MRGRKCALMRNATVAWNISMEYGDNWIDELCSTKGVRATSSRRVILSILIGTKGHLGAEEICRISARTHRLSLATVYRNLKLFEELGMISSIAIGDGKNRYEIVATDNASHHHLIDIESGKIVEFNDPAIAELEANIAAKLGYKSVSCKFEIYAVPLREEE